MALDIPHQHSHRHLRDRLGIQDSKDGQAGGRRGSFDIPAAVSFTMGLLLLLVGVTWGLLYSWRDSTTIAALVLSPAFFVAFAIWEDRYSVDPILDFDFFRNRVFTFSIMAAMLQFVALFSVNFLLIFYLEGITGLSALTASYLIIPFAVANATLGPIGGLLSDKFGFRSVSAVGTLVLLGALLLFSQLTVSTTLLQIGGIEAASGIGLAFFWPANTSAIMSSTPPARYGVGSGAMNTFRNTGMVLSFALSLTAATSVIPTGVVYELFIGNLSGRLPPSLAISYLSGQRFAFEISAALLAVAFVFVLIAGGRPPREARPSPQVPPEEAPAPDA